MNKLDMKYVVTLGILYNIVGGFIAKRELDQKIENYQNRIDLLTSKLDVYRKELSEKLDKLDDKVENVKDKLGDKVESVKDKFDVKFESVKDKLVHVEMSNRERVEKLKDHLNESEKVNSLKCKVNDDIASIKDKLDLGVIDTYDYTYLKYGLGIICVVGLAYCGYQFCDKISENIGSTFKIGFRSICDTINGTETIDCGEFLKDLGTNGAGDVSRLTTTAGSALVPSHHGAVNNMVDRGITINNPTNINNTGAVNSNAVVNSVEFLKNLGVNGAGVEASSTITAGSALVPSHHAVVNSVEFLKNLGVNGSGNASTPTITGGSALVPSHHAVVNNIVDRGITISNSTNINERYVGFWYEWW